MKILQISTKEGMFGPGESAAVVNLAVAGLRLTGWMDCSNCCVLFIYLTVDALTTQLPRFESKLNIKSKTKMAVTSNSKE